MAALKLGGLLAKRCQMRLRIFIAELLPFVLFLPQVHMRNRIRHNMSYKSGAENELPMFSRMSILQL